MYLLYSSLLSDDDRWTWPLNEIHKNRFFCWNFLAFVARRHYFPDVDAIRGQKPAEKPTVTISFCLWGVTWGVCFPAGGPSRRPSCSAGRDWTLALWLLTTQEQTDEVSLGRSRVCSPALRPFICPLMETPDDQPQTPFPKMFQRWKKVRRCQTWGFEWCLYLSVLPCGAIATSQTCYMWSFIVP